MEEKWRADLSYKKKWRGGTRKAEEVTSMEWFNDNCEQVVLEKIMKKQNVAEENEG